MVSLTEIFIVHLADTIRNSAQTTRARLRPTRRRDGDRPRRDVGVLGPVHVWLAVRVDRIHRQRIHLPRHRARVLPGFEEARSPVVAHGRARGGRARGALAAARVRTMHLRVLILRRGRGDEPRKRRNALRRCVPARRLKPRRSRAKRVAVVILCVRGDSTTTSVPNPPSAFSRPARR